ncbi:serine racemase VanT catalytic subunit [Brevibacillus reuszeri]|uniref:serine racemase VanT catalytic subunit n=1 Tax=Brevibacillus reuszeri TaxID=54915 RepID=UPI0028982F1B|nr:serine racemase VanT catalytic subunit [Brevibacillus reuszeri]
MNRQVVSKENYGLIDHFKAIAAILVIAIHTGPFTTYNEYADFLFTGIVARLAVPFFFIASGFLLFQKIQGEAAQDRATIRRYVARIATLYGLAILIYLPINVYAGYFSSDFTVYTLVKDILFDGTMYHLWYFPALITGVLITFFLYKRFSFPVMLVIAGLLYMIGLLGDSYYGLIEQSDLLHAIYTQMFMLFDYTRNGLFFAPIYLILGAWIAKRPLTGQTRRVMAFGFALSFVLMLIEGILVNQGKLPRHDSMYIFLVPSVYFLFSFLLLQKGRGGPYIRQLTTWIYILHPFAIVLVRGISKATGTSAILVENSFIHFVAVTLLAICISHVVVRFLARKKTKRATKQRAWAEIKVAHLKHNLEELKRLLPPASELMAVVKANAYGHGSPQIAKILDQIGVRHFAVAELEEGIALRKQGIKGEILILGYTSLKNVSELIHYKLTQTVISEEYAASLDECGKKLQVHIKIDTGMGRLGEAHDNIGKILRMYRHEHLQVTGSYSHLSVSDSLNHEDIAYTKEQIDRFHNVIRQVELEGINPGILHIQSSYGILNGVDEICGMSRAGIALFGLLSKEDDVVNRSIDLHPVLSLHARVTLVKTIQAGSAISYGRNYRTSKNSQIATVSIGYADGIPRRLSEAGGYVLVRGQRASIVGNVCMDQLMIDVTHIPGVKEGDVVTLIGQDGGETITAEQLASRCNTITNEIVSGIGSRVERVYVE